MADLLIIAHAPLASTLRSVGAHAFPEAAAAIGVVDVTPVMTPDDVEALARAWVRPDTEVLVMVDVFGATTCNGAQRLSDNPRVRVVTGVNVPMLWRAVCYCNEPLDSLASIAFSGASQGVMQVTSTRPQNQATTGSRHDPNHAHHQQ